MVKKLLGIFVFGFAIMNAYAQELKVTGTVLDRKDNIPLARATVRIIHLPDSAIRGGYSDTKGNFSVALAEAGNYFVRISFLGYEEFQRNISISDRPIELGKILLSERPKTTDEVEVVGKLPAAIQKNDTTELAAGAYKVNPDASTEDLVTKMPGVTVQDGKVQAQGEEVKQVLVDGKPFFGEDPNAALRNLPAEVVDRIQIFDQQSDQGQFTGSSGGNTQKTINVITKQNMRNGQFGRINGGYGEDNRYRFNGNINFFNDAQRITLLLQSNNISEQNFSIEDLVGAMGGGGGPMGQMMRRGGGGAMMMMRGGGGFRGGGMMGGLGDFLVSPREGISTTHAVGLNYSDSWASNLDITASYFFNWGNTNSDQDIFRQFVLPSDSGLYYSENNNSRTKNINHRFNSRFTWRIDTMNTLLIRPRLSFQSNDGDSKTLGENFRGQTRLNSLNNFFSSKLEGLNFNNDLLYTLRLNDEGRSFSININTGYNNNGGNNQLSSENIFSSQDSTTLEQNSDLTRNGLSLGTNLAYNEPLSKTSSIQISYNNSLNRNDVDKKTFSNMYSDTEIFSLDTVQSNEFRNDYFTQSGGAGYRYSDKELQLSADLNYQLADLSNEQKFPFTSNIKRSFRNFLPSAMMRYSISETKNLRLFYRSATNPPSVDQLQSVVNNTNPLQLTRGNPNLAQDFQNNIFIHYSSVSQNNSAPFFAMLGASFTRDYIGNSTIIAANDTIIEGGTRLARGAQLTQPVNLNGYASFRSFVTYGWPIELISSNLNFNAGAFVTRTPGLINGQENISTSPVALLGLVLSSNISENFDFTISSNSTWTIVDNSLRKELNSNYFNQNSRFRLGWIFWEGFNLQTDLSHQFNSGLSSGFNQNFILWNASLGKKFLNNMFEIRLTVNDILNQNNSIRRNITDSYIEDVRTDVLQRYAMLQFFYNLRNFGGGDAQRPLRGER